MTVRRKTGRPLSFDRDKALRAAMLLFWRHGYETTSVAELTAAMGISPPSLYAAFGDKKQLFLEAVQLYAGDPAELERAIADAPSAMDAARTLLRSSAIAYTGEDTPPGCLLASATASGSTASAEVQAAVAEVRRATEDALRRRIEQDIAAGTLRSGTSAEALASLTLAVVQGMSVLARDGAPRAKLLALAEQAMQAWPATTPIARQSQ